MRIWTAPSILVSGEPVEQRARRLPTTILGHRFRTPVQHFSINLRQEYIEAWASVFPENQATFIPTIEDALDFARSLDEGRGIQVLVTGACI